MGRKKNEVILKTGVYFLIYKKKVVYIGQSTVWPKRLKQHRNKRFDSYRFIECHPNKRYEYETRLIMFFKPKYNYHGVKTPFTTYLMMRDYYNNQSKIIA